MPPPTVQPITVSDFETKDGTSSKLFLTFTSAASPVEANAVDIAKRNREMTVAVICIEIRGGLSGWTKMIDRCFIDLLRRFIFVHRTIVNKRFQRTDIGQRQNIH